MTQQIVKRYLVTFQRQVIEETERLVYANSEEEADFLALQSLFGDDMPHWDFAQTWQTDDPITTSKIIEDRDWSDEP